MKDWQVSPPVAQFIASRGLDRASLSPTLELSPNPALHKAAKQIIAAIEANKTIRIHGDYDADGVTATAVLVLGLQRLGANVHGFLPHRLKEGYGIHPSRVAEHGTACDLLVTVDCGVTNVAEVRELVEGGTEVIVTDHHMPAADFPRCLVVHPHLTPHYDPEHHNLTGAGVAYHLLWAIHETLGKEAPTDLSTLACIGTVADVAPLMGENRALVQLGLQHLSETSSVGLRTILRAKNLPEPTARDVAFKIAPLINVAGRMGKVDLALELLTTTSETRATELVAELENLNRERRLIQDKMFEQAKEMVNSADSVLVLTHPDWHAGVMGIVASKLVEAFYKPVYIIAQGKGSVRSTPNISAVEGLKVNSHLLGRYGGHMGAAGFALDEKNIPALAQGLREWVAQFETPIPEVVLDAVLPPEQLQTVMSDLEALSPFGEGIRTPVWHIRCEPTEQKGMGTNSLQLTLGGIRGVTHGRREPLDGICDIAAEGQISVWRGRKHLEWSVNSIRPAEPLSAENTAKSPKKQPLPFSRWEPETAMTLPLKMYAPTENIAAYIAARHPAALLVKEGDVLEGAGLVLFGLPTEEQLHLWAKETHAAGQPLLFAWGKHTRAAMRSESKASPQSAEEAARLYRLFQWVEHYEALGAEAWSEVTGAMLGVEEA